jgi:hypothetical protein
MANKSVGMRIVSILVAVAALLFSTMWVENIKAKVETTNDAVTFWNTTYRAVNDSDFMEKSFANSDEARARLEKTIQQIRAFDEAEEMT